MVQTKLTTAHKWQKLAHDAAHQKSAVWEDFPIDSTHAERVRRYRYYVPKAFAAEEEAQITIKDTTQSYYECEDDSVTPQDVPDFLSTMTSSGCKWKIDTAVVKMCSEPFASGAMRNCFRMKKLPQDPHAHVHALDWKHAPNYVSKCYKNEDTERDQYFLDVRVQTEAGHWARLYNEREPPKKVDMIYTFVIEFIDRPGSPLFCVERFIEGDYIKHNSNSGFLEDKLKRLTPQCFSHFTYHASKGEIIVVDIQGVDDLYTDPQIHTHDFRFGTGDMGFRGMALFFSSHTCNPLCKILELPEFEHTPEELSRLKHEEKYVGPVNSDTSNFRFDANLKIKKDEESAHLAKTHFELVQLHLVGRFSNGQPDYVSALYHLHKAAQGGVKEALVSLAKSYAGQDSQDGDTCDSIDGDVFLFPKEFLNAVSIEDATVAVSLWKYAAEFGSLEGMVQLAKAFKDGAALGQPFAVDWKKSFEWFEAARSKAKSKTEDSTTILTVLDSGESISMFNILKEEADMLSTGGSNLDKDIDTARDLYFEAGNMAMAAGDMFTANQCFLKAESLQ